MRLGEVINKLFRKRSQPDIEQREMAEDIYKPLDEKRPEEVERFSKIERNILREQTGEPGEALRQEKLRRMSLALFAILVVVILLVSLGGVIYMRIVNSAFKESNVKVLIQGPEVVEAGDTVTYKILVNNSNRIDLKDAVLDLYLPDSLILKDKSFFSRRTLAGAQIVIGDIKKRQTKEYIIELEVGYNKDNLVSFRADMRYRPENVSSYFRSDVLKNIKIKAPRLDVSVFGPDTVGVGELVSLDIIVRNDEEKAMNNFFVVMSYPAGFILSEVIPEMEGKNYWLINSLNPGEELKFTVKGRLNGTVDEIKRFYVKLSDDQQGNSVINQTEKDVKIIPSRVVFHQEASRKFVSPGESLTYTIKFKNNSATPLRNLIIQTHLPDKYIKRSEVLATNGYYDSRENVLTWRAADNKQLELLQPNEEGTLKFDIMLPEIIIPRDKKEKNLVLTSYSEIESLDVDSPIFENKKIISEEVKTPINSFVKLEKRLIYIPQGEDDDFLKVDKKSYIRVKLALFNTTNKLKNVRLEADLPSGVKWEKHVYPEGDNLDFDKRSHRVKWKMGVVDVGTGFLSPAEKAEFVISVTPSLNQQKQAIPLLENLQVTAEDMFTGQKIGYQITKISSDEVDGLRFGEVVIED